jgi:acetyltransferase-like isoleucine patch superfamily enzyme
MKITSSGSRHAYFHRRARVEFAREDLFTGSEDGILMSVTATFIHPTAEVSTEATIGEGCRVWRQAQIRERATVGAGSIIGAGVYVGAEVQLGRNCKIQNNALLYEGLTLEDGVFVGPQVCFTNDFLPRAVNPDLSLKSADDWDVGRTLVRQGAAVGAQSVVLTGVTIGQWALVGAGSVVTHDVPEHALVHGQPARIRGWVCACARGLQVRRAGDAIEGWCSVCNRAVRLPREAAQTGESA